MKKELWLRADRPDDSETRKEMITAGLESGINSIIVRKNDGSFSSLGKFELIINDGGTLSGTVSGAVVNIASPGDQKKAGELAGKKDVIVITTADWTIIPLENMIAKFQNSGTKVMACVSSAEEIKLFGKILETGVDGFVIDVKEPSEISKLAKLSENDDMFSLSSVKVTSIRNIQIGDRVCIDTCTSMIPGEGMLIGSQASCLFLVQSESEDSGYVASRPFRVNAGAVHAYVLVPGGKTRYLSELRSGDDVLSVDRNGMSKPVSIGRCKTEIRPMLIVEATDGKRNFSTVLQNAETVKLVTASGSISVSKLKPGDEVLAMLANGGRHFGMQIEETIREI